MPSKSGSKYFLNDRKYLEYICTLKGSSDKIVVFYFFSSHDQFGWHTKFWSYLATPSCFLQISLQILVIFDQKNIWHKLLGVVYHVKKVSKLFDENLSHNINLKKKCSISWKVIWKPIVQWPTSLGVKCRATSVLKISSFVSSDWFVCFWSCNSIWGSCNVEIS